MLKYRYKILSEGEKMITDTKKLSVKAFSIIALYSLFTYLIAHMAYLYMNTDTGLIFEYISLYLSKVTEFVLPTVITALVMIIYVSCGKGKAVSFAFIASAGRVVYTLPYYYIIFIYNHGYDSLESLALSTIASVFVVLFTGLGAFIALWIALLLIGKAQKRSNSSLDAKTYILESLEQKQKLSEFWQGANYTVLIFAIYRFILALIPEIIDTVIFFIEYRLDYTIIEIITIMLNYVLLFALIVISYAVAVFIKNRAVKAAR